MSNSVEFEKYRYECPWFKKVSYMKGGGTFCYGRRDACEEDACAVLYWIFIVGDKVKEMFDVKV